MKNEKWIWLESPAKVVHGAEYCFLAYDRSRKKLLQGNHAEIGHKEVWPAQK